jgi:hypothetical protein
MPQGRRQKNVGGAYVAVLAMYVNAESPAVIDGRYTGRAKPSHT